MARDYVYRCDGCNVVSDPSDLETVLIRNVKATTTDFKRSAELCPLCQDTVTVRQILELASARTAEANSGTQ